MCVCVCVYMCVCVCVCVCVCTSVITTAPMHAMGALCSDLLMLWKSSKSFFVHSLMSVSTSKYIGMLPFCRSFLMVNCAWVVQQITIHVVLQSMVLVFYSLVPRLMCVTRRVEGR